MPPVVDVELHGVLDGLVVESDNPAGRPPARRPLYVYRPPVVAPAAPADVPASS